MEWPGFCLIYSRPGDLSTLFIWLWNDLGSVWKKPLYLYILKLKDFALLQMREFVSVLFWLKPTRKELHFYNISCMNVISEIHFFLRMVSFYRMCYNGRYSRSMYLYWKMIYTTINENGATQQNQLAKSRVPWKD